MKPNLSKRVTSDDCKGCGRCCEVFEIWYPPADGSLQTDIIRSEIQRFRLLAGVGDAITTRDDHMGGTWLVFNIPCRFLREDKTCAIYNSPERPLMCRHFPYGDSTRDDCPRLNGGQ